jgi:hypothetical protein
MKQKLFNFSLLFSSYIHWKMPTERLEKQEQKAVQTDVPKPARKTLPFSDPNISPALRKLRAMLKADKINEADTACDSAGKHASGKGSS